GRVYTVYVTAVDNSGNSSTVECKIAVRHNVNGSATDDGVGAGYAVASNCGTAKAVAMGGTPAGFTLEQNFPNPFNPSTEIRFHVAEDSELRLVVLDALGREVAVLASGTVNAGNHTVTFQADNLPSGLYFYRLEAQGRAVTKRMMLMK
ncbi:MAG: T9SS type A sorting domain-containing protein, partial [Bacteroidetes bacterium]|nr:T9SS type A sorting domain-containing protein [Bacteroidota bacterium]